MAQADSAYPQTITNIIQVGDESVSVACTTFTNQILLMLSSHGKLGHLFRVTKESPVDRSLDPAEDLVTVEVLLGADLETVSIASRYMAEKVLSELSRKDILIAVSLKDHSRPFIRELTEKLLDVIRCEK